MLLFNCDYEKKKMNDDLFFVVMIKFISWSDGEIAINEKEKKERSGNMKFEISSVNTI